MAYVETSEIDGVATLTLSQAGRKNALNEQMQGELDEILQRLRTDSNVRAIILNGAGGDFCSGGDISAMEQRLAFGAEAGRARMLEQQRTYKRLLDFDRPVIAAVDGVAFGAGFSYALAADIVIASTRARFCLSSAKVGLLPDLGVLHALPRLIGLQRTRELIYTARELSAEEARSIGLVLEVSSPDELHKRAQTIARSMTLASPNTFAMTKALLSRSFDIDRDAMFDAEASAQGIAFGSEYVREAVTRFMRREPLRFRWPAVGEAGS